MEFIPDVYFKELRTVYETVFGYAGTGASALLSRQATGSEYSLAQLSLLSLLTSLTEKPATWHLNDQQREKFKPIVSSFMHVLFVYTAAIDTEITLIDHVAWRLLPCVRQARRLADSYQADTDEISFW